MISRHQILYRILLSAIGPICSANSHGLALPVVAAPAYIDSDKFIIWMETVWEGSGLTVFASDPRAWVGNKPWKDESVQVMLRADHLNL